MSDELIEFTATSIISFCICFHFYYRPKMYCVPLNLINYKSILTGKQRIIATSFAASRARRNGSYGPKSFYKYRLFKSINHYCSVHFSFVVSILIFIHFTYCNRIVAQSFYHNRYNVTFILLVMLWVKGWFIDWHDKRDVKRHT